MPAISFFYGIVIRMYFEDHEPPHFHAVYAEYEAQILISSGEILAGNLPNSAARLVKEWALARRTDLMDNWVRAHAGKRLERIVGLDAD